MPKFVFAYHGGSMPETEEEGEKVMKQWSDWLDGMGPAAFDQGNPVGMSKTVTASGVEDNGGSNPLSGYSIIEADSMDSAVEIAKGCPIFPDGTVEVAEIHEM